MSIIYPYRSSSALGCDVGEKRGGDREVGERDTLSLCLSHQMSRGARPQPKGAFSRWPTLVCTTVRAARSIPWGRRYHCAVRTQHLDTFIYRQKSNCTCRNSEKLVIFTSSLIKAFQNVVVEMWGAVWWWAVQPYTCTYPDCGGLR